MGLTAIDWLEGWGLGPIAAHEAELLSVAQARLAEIQSRRSTAAQARLVITKLKGAHPHDIGTILDREGIACGLACAEPLMNRLGKATVRASFAATIP